MEFFARICTYFVFSRKVEYAARLRRAGVQWEYIRFRVCGFFYCSIMYIRVRQHAEALNGVLYELSHYEPLNRRK